MFFHVAPMLTQDHFASCDVSWPSFTRLAAAAAAAAVVQYSALDDGLVPTLISPTANKACWPFQYITPRKLKPNVTTRKFMDRSWIVSIMGSMSVRIV